MAVGRKRGIVTYRATECPHCGSVRSRVKAIGYSDEPESYRIRYRRCIDCDETYTTAEVVVPGTTFYRLEPHHREKRRLAERDRYGYIGEHPKKRVESDRVQITVKVKRWANGR